MYVCMYVYMYVFLLILWSDGMLKKTAEKYRVQGNGLFSKKKFKSAFKFYQDAEQVCLYYSVASWIYIAFKIYIFDDSKCKKKKLNLCVTILNRRRFKESNRFKIVNTSSRWKFSKLGWVSIFAWNKIPVAIARHLPAPSFLATKCAQWRGKTLVHSTHSLAHV